MREVELPALDVVQRDRLADVDPSAGHHRQHEVLEERLEVRARHRGYPSPEGSSFLSADNAGKPHSANRPTGSLPIVADCVEDEVSLKLLEGMGVDMVQGYHLDMPKAEHPAIK